MTFTVERPDLGLPKGRENFLFLASKFVGEGVDDAEAHINV